MNKTELLAEISQFPLRFSRDVRQNGYYFAWNIKCHRFNLDRVKRLAHEEHKVPEKYDERWDQYLQEDKDNSLWNMLADELLRGLCEGLAGSESITLNYTCVVGGRSGGWLFLESYKGVSMPFDGATSMLMSLGEEDEPVLQGLLDVLNFLEDTCKDPNKTMEEQYAFHYYLVADEWACAERKEEESRLARLHELCERDQPVI